MRVTPLLSAAAGITAVLASPLKPTISEPSHPVNACCSNDDFGTVVCHPCEPGKTPFPDFPPIVKRSESDYPACNPYIYPNTPHCCEPDQVVGQNSALQCEYCKVCPKEDEAATDALSLVKKTDYPRCDQNKYPNTPRCCADPDFVNPKVGCEYCSLDACPNKQPPETKDSSLAKKTDYPKCSKVNFPEAPVCCDEPDIVNARFGCEYCSLGRCKNDKPPVRKNLLSTSTASNQVCCGPESLGDIGLQICRECDTHTDSTNVEVWTKTQVDGDLINIVKENDHGLTDRDSDFFPFCCLINGMLTYNCNDCKKVKARDTNDENPLDPNWQCCFTNGLQVFDCGPCPPDADADTTPTKRNVLRLIKVEDINDDIAKSFGESTTNIIPRNNPDDICCFGFGTAIDSECALCTKAPTILGGWDVWIKVASRPDGMNQYKQVKGNLPGVVHVQCCMANNLNKFPNLNGGTGNCFACPVDFPCTAPACTSEATEMVPRA